MRCKKVYKRNETSKRRLWEVEGYKNHEDEMQERRKEEKDKEEEKRKRMKKRRRRRCKKVYMSSEMWTREKDYGKKHSKRE